MDQHRYTATIRHPQLGDEQVEFTAGALADLDELIAGARAAIDRDYGIGWSPVDVHDDTVGETVWARLRARR